ncbi:MAG: transcriptional repressor [Thermosipho sp. (in: Bacteria)]|nr:transcriptional repressor [Thermosipho sp. (in: thermotogales)]
MEKVAEILKKAGIKPTLQRLHILKIILDGKRHMSAEEIYKFLNQEVPTISRATVYNTLNLLSKKGVLLEIVTPDAVKYDYIEKPHHHFYCERCKRIYDIHEELPSLNLEKIEGHLVKSIQYYIVGICENCLNGGE